MDENLRKALEAALGTSDDVAVLNAFIESKLGGEYVFHKSLIPGHISGVIDHSVISITHKADEYCILVTEKGGSLERLIPVLQEYMGAEPICGYDGETAVGLGKARVFSTIEWDVVEPEVRIAKVIDGSAFLDGQTATNINLYGGRQIGDYLNLGGKDISDG